MRLKLVDVKVTGDNTDYNQKQSTYLNLLARLGTEVAIAVHALDSISYNFLCFFSFGTISTSIAVFQSFFVYVFS